MMWEATGMKRMVDSRGWEEWGVAIETRQLHEAIRTSRQGVVSALPSH